MTLNGTVLQPGINAGEDGVDEAGRQLHLHAGKKAALRTRQINLPDEMAASVMLRCGHVTGLIATRYFFNASRISVSRSTSLGPAGGAIFAKKPFALRTIRKMMKARIRKLISLVMKLP
ncbi:MAG: hypothetical protein RIS00_1964 [Pseudomonadota bacterium]